MNKIFTNRLFNLRNGALGMAVALLFTATVAQPTNALSAVNTIRCNTLTAFASASVGTLKTNRQIMQAAFDLQLNVLQGAWKLEDQATAAIRHASEGTFVTLVNAFANVPSLTATRKASIKTYKDVVVNAIHLLETNVDALEAAYREDMLALINAHQKALTNFVATLTTTITNAVNKAVADCSENGVVVTLVGVITQANLTLAANIATQDIKDLGSAANIAITRDKGFLQQDGQFLGTVTTAELRLTKAMLTGKPYGK
jgi:hypothetical protein